MRTLHRSHCQWQGEAETEQPAALCRSQLREEQEQVASHLPQREDLPGEGQD